ncbi:hypothetical protein N6B72_12810 [Chryseobacterium soli]|uniref:hypothetical protein n=1 Tax=Chryseobacterium soli TaxID=445961 RepID=UPI002954C972|nr:hypothetical protein [Chryseobacterium soli]MDV7697804.1 hypothetical protein [Chryseobacterium soli]
MKKIITLFVVCFLTAYSCHKNETNGSHPKTDTITNSTTPQTPPIQEVAEQISGFPATGKKASDFVSGTYEIQYEAEGDLNQDGLPDLALVVKKKADTLAGRTILVILKNPDTTYKLDKVSTKAFPDEYNGDGYKMHDPEDISIEKGELHINLYDIGPNGNLFSTFKYLNNNLILTYIETYNMGAGSHQALYYEPMKGKLVQEVTNTMEEDTPTTSKTFHLKKENYRFESISPDNIIRKVYGSVDVE